MKLEWQVDINRIELPEQIFGIVIGDEGCIYRTLDSRWIGWVEKALTKNLVIRYVTPIVPNQYIEELFNYIVDLTAIVKLKVTFNDYGMLYRCKQLIEKDLITPVLGRIITRSIVDCPWIDELLKHEDPSLTVAITGSNLVHQSKWDIMQKYRIKEIEVNSSTLKDAVQLRRNRLILTGYTSNALVSVGRVCYSARWQGLELPQCCNDPRCLKKLFIEIDQKWGKMKLIYEEPSEQVKEKYQGLFIRGNIVYKQLSEQDPQPEMFDFVIT